MVGDEIYIAHTLADTWTQKALSQLTSLFVTVCVQSGVEMKQRKTEPLTLTYSTLSYSPGLARGLLMAEIMRPCLVLGFCLHAVHLLWLQLHYHIIHHDHNLHLTEEKLCLCMLVCLREAAEAVGLRAGCLGEAEGRGYLQYPQLDSMAEVLNVSVEGGMRLPFGLTSCMPRDRKQDAGAGCSRSQPQSSHLLPFIMWLLA